jgi:hypothetical protein
MPGLVPGIHVLAALRKRDVDGRDKPGHDEKENHFHVVRKRWLHFQSDSQDVVREFEPVGFTESLG